MRTLPLGLTLVAVLLCSHAAAQFVQQGNKLVGTGAVGSAQQGISVALSSDGNTAIAGGRGDNGNAGAAWIFTRSGGGWTQQGNKLVGTGAVGNAQQGISVALSSDGNTAIVGAHNDNSDAGAAWIYTRSGGVWTQQGNKLVGTGAVGKAWQGHSVALSSDGNTAIVGGLYDNANAGAAWVFTRSEGVWTQQGNKLVGTGAVGSSLQGIAVALSSDGNTALVGGAGDNSDVGAVWVFTRSGGVWTQQGNKLVVTGAVGSPYQGYAVSLSGDGNSAIVGGFNDNGGLGAAWVFTRSSGLWSQQAKLVGTGAVGNAWQGHSVSISSDGNTALVGGGVDNSYVGATWVFTRNGAVWSQQGEKLIGTGAVGNASQGVDVSISSDGTTAVWGGLTDNSSLGAMWVFVRPMPQPAGLVAYYPFNGNANDESGNGFNGSASGATITSDRFGQAGKAYAFDGTNDYIQLPNLPPMDVLSLSAWFYPTYIPSASHAFITALFGRDQHPWMGAGLSTMNDSLVATLSYSDMTYSEVHIAPVSLNAWHHAVLVYDGSMGTVYLDNKLAWSASLGKALNLLAAPSFIGRDRPSGTEYWFGRIDDVRVYGRVLSLAELDSLYRLGGWATLPLAPNLIYPQNGAGVTAGVVPFIWSKASLDATSYWIETATDSLFTYRSVDSTVVDTTKVVTLPTFGRYWWRVKARNVYGWGPFSTEHKLTYGLTDADDPSVVPTAYELGQNYPNPFNPTTSIRYGLPMRVYVKLTVFNSLGQEIAVLNEGEQEAGYHEVKFDASNLSSGVYLYRLQAGGFVQTRKFLLIR